MKHIGIICAMPDEVDPFRRAMEIEDEFWVGAMQFWKGQYEGKKLTLIQSGAGKVHAAAATQMLISQFAPDAIFSCGAAGSLDPQYQIGDIIVGERTVHHDYGFVVPETFIHFGLQIRRAKKKPAFLKEFSADGELFRIAKSINEPREEHLQIFYGTILSGDQVILSSEKRQWLADQFQALAVDMESAAIAQVAYMHAAPFLAVRAISDYADETMQIDISKLDPNEFGEYSSASLGEKIRLLTKAMSYFAQHPSAFALSLQARRNIKKAAQSSATFSLHIIRSLR
jgi:adenosylhomocysteine nucleosidase